MVTKRVRVIFYFEKAKENAKSKLRHECVQMAKRKRPFPSSKNSHFQNEATCETSLVKMSFSCMRTKNFHVICFPASLALKQRLAATRPITISIPAIFAGNCSIQTPS